LMELNSPGVRFPAFLEDFKRVSRVSSKRDVRGETIDFLLKIVTRRLRKTMICHDATKRPFYHTAGRFDLGMLKSEVFLSSIS